MARLVSRSEKYDIYIGRGQNTVWGNPFASKRSKFPTYRCNSVMESVGCYARWICGQPDLDFKALKDKRLACWCPLNQLCHGQVLVALANGESIEKFIALVSDERYAAILIEGMR